MGTMESALEKFNTVLNNYKARIGALGQERVTFRTSAETKFKEIDVLIGIIREKIRVLEQRISDNAILVQENEGFKREIASLNVQLSKLQSEKNEIEGQIKGLQEQNANLTTENSTNKEQINTLTKELAAKTEEIAINTRAIETAKAANDNLHKQITNNIKLINEATLQLEQELSGLNVDNTQIDTEILGKLEELRRRLAGMGSGSAMSSDRSASLAKRISRVYYVNNAPPHRIEKEEFIRLMNDVIEENTLKKNAIETYLTNNPLKDLFIHNDKQLGDLFQNLSDIDYQRIMEIELGFPHQTIPPNAFSGGRPKSKKTKRKRKTITKGKRINNMRRTTNKRRKLRGGWTYKGSPSLDSKSSVITESSKTKSGKSKSRSNKSKSNKKHKSKKVIRRYKR